MSQDLRINDAGTRFLVTVQDNDGAVVDLSPYTTKQVTFIPPDKVPFTKNMTFSTDGADGQLYYIIQSGDLVQEGYWKFYINVANASGNFSSDRKVFFVNGVA